jgi:hypothetical protein
MDHTRSVAGEALDGSYQVSSRRGIGWIIPGQ